MYRDEQNIHKYACKFVYCDSLCTCTQQCKQVNISSIQVRCNSAMQVKWHSGELESSRVQQSYGLRDDAVPEPGGAGPNAVVPSAGQQQAEQFVAGVTGVFNDPVDLIPTRLGVEVLHGWQLHPGNVLWL